MKVASDRLFVTKKERRSERIEVNSPSIPGTLKSICLGYFRSARPAITVERALDAVMNWMGMACAESLAKSPRVE